MSTTPDLSELETIVAAVEEHAIAPTPASDPDRYPALRASHERASAIVIEALAPLDTERAELDRLRREHDEARRRLDDDVKRAATEGAAAASQRLDSLVAAQRAVLEALPDDLFGPDSDLLLEVDFIRSWPTPENLRDWHQEPGLNWAKYRVQDSGGGVGRQASEKVSFYTYWQNPRDVPVLADFLVRLTVNGHCKCGANSVGVASWFISGSRSSVDVSARLTLWGLWADPARLFPVDRVPLQTLNASGGFFGDSNQATISTAPAVTARQFPIPARAYILIEASVVADYELLNGDLDLDFASDNLFSVGVPYAVVTLPREMMVNP
jgi:hypothetical protein